MEISHSLCKAGFRYKFFVEFYSFLYTIITVGAFKYNTGWNRGKGDFEKLRNPAQHIRGAKEIVAVVLDILAIYVGHLSIALLLSKSFTKPVVLTSRYVVLFAPIFKLMEIDWYRPPMRLKIELSCLKNHDTTYLLPSKRAVDYKSNIVWRHSVINKKIRVEPRQFLIFILYFLDVRVDYPWIFDSDKRNVQQKRYNSAGAGN